jgi:hypothetical protein
MQDYEVRVRSLLQDHLRSSRELLSLRRGEVGPVAAETALAVVRADVRRVAQIAPDRCIAREIRETASGRVGVSRQLIRMKEQEFADLDGGGVGYDRGMAVGARLSPKPPSLSGRDAKPTPEGED